MSASWRAFSSPVICHPLTPASLWNVTHGASSPSGNTNLGVFQDPTSAVLVTRTSSVYNLFLSGRLRPTQPWFPGRSPRRGYRLPGSKHEARRGPRVFPEVWVGVRLELELRSTLNLSLLRVVLELEGLMPRPLLQWLSHRMHDSQR